MTEGETVYFFEGAVALVEIIIIILVEIVAYIDIVVSVVIEIGHGDPETVSQGAAIDAGRFGNIGEMSTVVSEELAAAFGTVLFPERDGAICIRLVGGML